MVCMYGIPYSYIHTYIYTYIHTYRIVCVCPRTDSRNENLFNFGESNNLSEMKCMYVCMYVFMYSMNDESSMYVCMYVCMYVP